MPAISWVVSGSHSRPISLDCLGEPEISKQPFSIVVGSIETNAVTNSGAYLDQPAC